MVISNKSTKLRMALEEQRVGGGVPKAKSELASIGQLV